MRKFIALLWLFICSCSDNLKKSTPAIDHEQYQVSISEPNDRRNFYYRLYDSLDRHIEKINNNTLRNFSGADNDSDFVLGWLQDQFENENAGLERKAACKNEADRTSDEFLLKNGGLFSSGDRACFSVIYRTDSIPKELLSSDLWNKAVSQNKLTKHIEAEKEKYKNGGTLIRHQHGDHDTLYAYPYELNIEITLHYFKNGKGDPVKSAFTIPSQTVVYHQLALSH